MTRIEVVQDLNKKMEEDNKYIEDILKNKKKIKKTEKTIIITPEIFSKIFSPQRINLMLEIKKLRSSNIYQIAKKLGRSYEAVYRDIKLLEGFDIIKIKIENKKSYPYMEPLQIPVFAKA